MKRWAHNAAAFSTVEDEPTAYWLGFLFADGNLTANHGRYLRLWLKETDRDHLAAFLAFLVSDHPIRTATGRHAVGVDISSPTLFADLERHGCHPRKSLTLEFPTVLPRLVNHFARGYFDGDGSAFWASGSPNLTLAGTSCFLTTLQCIIASVTGITGRLRPHSKSSIHYLCYRGQFRVPPVRDWFYSSATVWLPRKRDRLDAFPPGKRKGYPGEHRSTAGHVASETIRQYIEAQSTRD